MEGGGKERCLGDGHWEGMSYSEHVNCVKLVNHKPVPLKQIIHSMLIKKKKRMQDLGVLCSVSTISKSRDHPHPSSMLSNASFS